MASVPKRDRKATAMVSTERSSQAIAVYVRLLAEAGIHGIDLSDFDDRMFLSKFCYVAGSIGLGCGDRFMWGLRGPYSPDLMEEFLGADWETARAHAASVLIDGSAFPKLLWLGSLVRERPTGSTRGTWLEAVATLAYLLDHGADTERLLAEGGSSEAYYVPAMGYLLGVGKVPG